MRRRPATRRWPVVTRPTEDENRELIRRARAGDRDAREEFIRRNTPLVASLANRHRRGEHDTEDLIQEGLIQLNKAVDTFDLSLGTMVSTYACRKIRAGMGHWWRLKGNMVHVPENLQSDNRQMMDLKRRDPKGYVLTMRHAAAAMAPAASIYAGDDDGHCIADRLAAREDAGPRDVLDMTWDAVSRRLDSKAEHILRRRYFEGETLREVADGLGVSKQYVQQTEARAIKRLREILADKTA